MLYLNLTIDRAATRLQFQRIASLLFIFLAAILSLACSKQPETTVENVLSVDQADTELMVSGQWREPDTGLIWMRCSIGQKWTGFTCTGTPVELNWKDANNYFKMFNQNDFAREENWRLPEIHEFAALRRCSEGWSQKRRNRSIQHEQDDVPSSTEMTILPDGRYYPLRCASESVAPTLDEAIFPNSPDTGAYWSSSSDDIKGKYAWSATFYSGYIGDHYLSSNNFYLRAVRTRQ